jgi:mannose-binding lectin 2
LKLQLQYKEGSEWLPCFEVGSIKLPSVSYLGFSAETGELSDNHDVVRVETRNLYSEYKTPSRGDQGAGGGRGAGSGRPYKVDHPNGRRKGGWGWWFLKLVIFSMIIAGAYIGYTMWRAQKRGRF